jgi:adenylylsulfate kinase
MKERENGLKNIILVMGLSGSGKTYFCESLLEVFPDEDLAYFNADFVRDSYNDWDFSKEGRLRQVKRMRDLADSSNKSTVIIDMICPLKEMRSILKPDTIFFIDRIKESKYEDTDRIFEPPTPSECSSLFVIIPSEKDGQ